MKVQFLFLLTFLFFVHSLFGQEITDIEELLGNNYVELKEDQYEEILDKLIYYQEYPLNLNTTTRDSLQQLYLLSDSQIDNILQFRQHKGKFLHINELLWVAGISRSDLENISSFVTVEFSNLDERISTIKHKTLHEIFGRVRTTLPRQEGYTKYTQDYFDKESKYETKRRNRFQGPPLSTLIKYKVKIGTYLQVGATLENDAGEAYAGEYQKELFDFVSAHLCLNTTIFIDKIILGDFKVQWGQGLLIWGGFSGGKSGMTLATEKGQSKISPYTSTDENNFMRGLALSLFKDKALNLEVFASRNNVDAGLIEMDTLSNEDILSSSLHTTGYHRNINEGQKKDNIKESSLGASLKWNTENFKLGLNSIYYNFDPPLASSTLPYKKFQETGKDRFLVSIDYKTGYRGYYLFGETAISDAGALATVNGLRKSLASASFNLIYRRYAKDYIARYANAFAEYSNTSNEEGLYLGAEIVPLRKLKINAYVDWFRFFSPRYRSYLPGSGWEALVETSYEHKKLKHLLRLKHEQKLENISGLDASVERHKMEFRYQLNTELNNNIELRTRFAYSFYYKLDRKENGYMAFQDFIFTSNQENFKLQARAAYFNTPSYESRIYAYENNVLYAYSFPMFMNEGLRIYVNTSWKITPKITAYAKLGMISYFDIDKISSGLSQVNSSTLCDLAFQLRIRF